MADLHALALAMEISPREGLRGLVQYDDATIHRSLADQVQACAACPTAAGPT